VLIKFIERHHFPFPSHLQSGFGLVETIVAVGLFMIIAGGGASVILQSLTLNRLSENQTDATLYAQEGLEATRSLQRQGWSNMSLGTYGLSSSSGGWAWTGTNNTKGVFTRQIALTSVQRNGSGTIVTSGGTVDPDTIKATSTVTWNFTPTRSNSVSLSQYFTNWTKQIGRGGMLIYADYSGADDVIRYKTLGADGTWSSEQTVPDTGVPLDRPTRRVDLYTSTTRNEKILISKHFANGAGNDQYVYAQVWNGSSWGNVVQLSSWAGATNPELRGYDGAYLNNGNFLLVYQDNTTTPKYRLWNGTSWSAATATTNIGSTPEWIVLKNRPGTNEAMVATADTTLDTNTFYWNGSSWSGATEHATTLPLITAQPIDFTWNKNTSTTGALVYNDANDATPVVRIWNGSSWSGAVQNQNIGGNTRSMQLVSYPSSNTFLSCISDANTQADINCLRTDFTPSWNTVTNGEIATDSDIGTQRSFSLAFEKNTPTTALSVYSNGVLATDRNIPKYRLFDASTHSFSSESSLSTVGAELESVELYPHPSSDDIMVVMAATDQDLWTVQWDGSSNQFYTTGGKAQTEQALNGSTDQDIWFDFAWDEN